MLNTFVKEAFKARLIEFGRVTSMSSPLIVGFIWLIFDFVGSRAWTLSTELDDGRRACTSLLGIFNLRGFITAIGVGPSSSRFERLMVLEGTWPASTREKALAIPFLADDSRCGNVKDNEKLARCFFPLIEMGDNAALMILERSSSISRANWFNEISKSKGLLRSTSMSTLTWFEGVTSREARWIAMFAWDILESSKADVPEMYFASTSILIFSKALK